MATQQKEAFSFLCLQTSCAKNDDDDGDDVQNTSVVAEPQFAASKVARARACATFFLFSYPKFPKSP